MREEEYGIYSEFNIEKHKETFTHYLEVIIDADGHVMYAVPSHQEKLIALACERLGVTRTELCAMTPEEYHWDFMTWLCKTTGCIAVWTHKYTNVETTRRQRATIRKLKMAGLYEGAVSFKNEREEEYKRDG